MYSHAVGFWPQDRKDKVKAPRGTPVISARVVTPGLIDTHTIVPLSGEYNIPADQDQDETSDPNQADARVLDGFNPAEPLLRFLLEQGVTVIHASPGRANVIGGLTGVFRTHGNDAEAMTVRFPQAMAFNLGVAPALARVFSISFLDFCADGFWSFFPMFGSGFVVKARSAIVKSAFFKIEHRDVTMDWDLGNPPQSVVECFSL